MFGDEIQRIRIRISTSGCLVLFLMLFSILSAQSEILFSRTFDEGGYETGFKIQRLDETGSIILGHRGSAWGPLMYWLMFVDENGDTLWTRSFGGEGEIAGYDLCQTADGGFVITGVNTRDGGATLDVWLIRTDQQGDTLWTRNYDRSEDDEGLAVTQTMDGGFLVAGETMNAAYGRDLWLLKTNSNGDIVQTRIYPSHIQTANLFASDIQAFDTGYLLVGTNYDWDSGHRVFLMMIDNNLDTLWTRYFKHRTYGLEEPELCITENGFIIGAHAWGWESGSAMFLLQTDFEGHEMFRQLLEKGTAFNSMTRTHDGDLMLAGVANKAVFIRCDADINPIWKFTINSPYEPWIASIIESQQNVFMGVGVEILPGDNTDLWLVSFTYDSSEARTDTTYTNTTVAGVDTTAVILEDFPPASPRNLVAIPDSGSVTLQWRPNTERDFYLYYIYGGTFPNSTTILDSILDIQQSLAEVPDLTNGITYFFHLTALDMSRHESNFSTEVAATPGVIERTDESDDTPQAFALYQNHPNPFNLATTIHYELPERASVQLVVYDLQGREVERLVGSYHEAGLYEATWNGRNRDGQASPSGIYIARLVTPQYTRSIKMLLLK